MLWTCNTFECAAVPGMRVSHLLAHCCCRCSSALLKCSGHAQHIDSTEAPANKEQMWLKYLCTYPAAHVHCTALPRQDWYGCADTAVHQASSASAAAAPNPRARHRTILLRLKMTQYSCRNTGASRAVKLRGSRRLARFVEAPVRVLQLAASQVDFTGANAHLQLHLAPRSTFWVIAKRLPLNTAVLQNNYSSVTLQLIRHRHFAPTQTPLCDRAAGHCARSSCQSVCAPWNARHNHKVSPSDAGLARGIAARSAAVGSWHTDTFKCA